MSNTSRTWGAGVEFDSAPATDAFAWRAQGTVLVVDDDEAVRDLVVDTLSRSGLEVVCAADGNQGIELFRSRADEIRAVMLDRTMPQTSGEQALVQIHNIRPEVPILLVSGYSLRSSTFPLVGHAGFLRKPFTPETLIENFRRMLDAA
jgi:two-component system cell cycle sensor histidine kinase/response regulator CckA